ncbi:hypothetical protein DMH01_00990 [Amycolatopsis sp. WAC 04182]|uniref:hypothetical protein n=1 Tax=Amycolatopsis sp. WAC 04182 TaxID=2203198 RepID=UPI000F7A19F4|nr:hypothetical protein [Amycolatopsis sp. WAC 04182]RSN65010.1 hypothetical protein DMH01_00990 [Amycolatopsis sp. WAC 04182]
MVDAMITWIGQKLAEKALDRAVPSGGRKRQRHDLSVQGAEATSDLDITVKYTLPYCRGAKAPVVLTLRRVDRFTESLRLDMVLGETARVRLKRGRYEITAKIHELSPRLGPEPILHAVGSQLLWLGGNGTAKACIRPAPVLIRAAGSPPAVGFRRPGCLMCDGPEGNYGLCLDHRLHVSRYIVEVLVPRMRAA